MRPRLPSRGPPRRPSRRCPGRPRASPSEDPPSPWPWPPPPGTSAAGSRRLLLSPVATKNVPVWYFVCGSRFAEYVYGLYFSSFFSLFSCYCICHRRRSKIVHRVSFPWRGRSNLIILGGRLLSVRRLVASPCPTSLEVSRAESSGSARALGGRRLSVRPSVFLSPALRNSAEASLCPTSLEVALKAVGRRPLRSRLLAASRGSTSLEVKLKLLLWESRAAGASRGKICAVYSSIFTK